MVLCYCASGPAATPHASGAPAVTVDVAASSSAASASSAGTANHTDAAFASSRTVDGADTAEAVNGRDGGSAHAAPSVSTPAIDSDVKDSGPDAISSPSPRTDRSPSPTTGAGTSHAESEASTGRGDRAVPQFPITEAGGSQRRLSGIPKLAPDYKQRRLSHSQSARLDSDGDASPPGIKRVRKARQRDVLVGHLVQILPSELFGIVRYVGMTRCVSSCAHSLSAFGRSARAALLPLPNAYPH